MCRADSSKPIPAERKTSVFPETPTNYESSFEHFEKQIAELESKIEKLSTNLFPSTATTSIPTNTATDKYEFAMDLWAQIASSTSIPAEVKPEIKKIILSAAFQP